MLNLDTNVVLRAVDGGLTPREQALLARDSWSISAIVLWEIAKLAQFRRIAVDLDTPELVSLLNQMRIWAIDIDVCREIARLDFHSDPADEIIGATSIVHAVPLVTRDPVIRKSKRVPLA